METEERKDSCKTCKFILGEGPAMFCKRFPPQVFLLPARQGEVGARSQFPPVNDALCCGEYIPKVELMN